MYYYLAHIPMPRFCQRVIPVTKVCHASLEDIEKHAMSVLEPHFHTDDLQRVKVRHTLIVTHVYSPKVLASHQDIPHKQTFLFVMGTYVYTIMKVSVIHLPPLSWFGEQNKLRNSHKHSVATLRLHNNDLLPLSHVCKY